ncbi:MAG TPA: DUF4276 family protein [Cellvibrio sp.]|nr:DUF4276 family protein [Cellvibrio sp.]
METQHFGREAKPMKRVCIVCEGQTEETFVETVLAPAFYGQGLMLEPQMIETSPGHKGGALNYDRVRQHLRNTLRQKSAPTVTTFFDLYKLDKRFPGFDEASTQTSLTARLEIIKRNLHEDVIQEAGCRPERFIPYIQPYEFEALLFSNISELTGLEAEWRKATEVLLKARNAVDSPEYINDKPETKPAAHLERELVSPKFRKTRHGPLAAQKIGLNKMESECQFFADWLNKIRQISKTP